ncbi:MAG: hypothetical protein ACI4A5_00085, partial [Hominilimicola sp.]
MNFGGAPTLSVSVSGTMGDRSQVQQSVLAKKGITFNDNGYTINKATLLAYMNANNLNRIVLTYQLRFPSQSTAGDQDTVFSAETRIIRDVFSLENVHFSDNYMTAAKDNYYYNQSSNEITVTANIKSTDNYNMFDSNQFNGKTLEFDKAYIKAGDYELAEKNASSTTIGSGYSENEEDSGNTITLSFACDKDIDSENKGITLFLEKARIEYDGTTYYLWDEQNHKLGFSNQNDNRDGYYKSTHKIDSKSPTVAINPANGVDLDKWNKTVTLSAVPSEDIYIQPEKPDATRPPSVSNMSLTDGSNKLYIYNKEGNGTPAVTQKVPATKDHETTITLALRDKVEGEYDFVLSGEDIAGNTLSSVYKGIKLDNKAPQISVTEKQGARNTDGTKGNTYNVNISDKSGTGRLYYMFTKKSIAEIPDCDENNVQKSSGDMDTTLDRWAYIDQKDAENGVSAYIKVNKGENFSGRMVYFAVDEAGNETNISSKDINIQNEDTACDITPKNVDKPLPAYTITVDTNSNNTIWYRWKNTANNTYITDLKQYSGVIDTSTDNATKSLNGTYILECKIVPPSGTNINYVSTNFVFDNEGPSINLTAPSADTSSLTQRVSVYATDPSDVASATGKIVNPDGTDIEGNEEFALNVSNGILSQNVTISDIPSGVYALKVTAVDTHGASASKISDAFIIRNASATGTVDVQSELSFAGRPLISGDSFKLCFDINEPFANPSYAKDQELYYRISTVSGEYGEWLDAGSVSPSDSIPDTLAAKLTVDAPQMSFVDGANTLFVQTVICSKNTDKSKISLKTVKNNEIMFYYDNTAPTANLVINDYHTKGSISGKLYVSDSLDSSFTAVCENPAVDISEPNGGVFDITVKENADTNITVSDTAGNKTDVKLVIKGIDTIAPTADIQTSEKTVGARKDAAATVKVNDVLDGTVKFAFIPVDKYNGNEIPDEYLQDNLENINFSVSEVNNQRATWDGESCITYNAAISGVTGEWYLGVRAADSLGNSTDIVFNENVLKAEDAELSLTISANPVKTETKTIATVSYNVPVYTLPQDKIVDASSDVVINNTLGIDEFEDLTEAEKVETANIELAKQYAMTYSNKYSFAANANGDYDLYTVDDLGRTNHLTATVSGVTFGAASDIKAVRAKKEWTDSSLVLTPYDDDDMICAAAYSGDYVIVEPSDANSHTLLLPINPDDFNTIYNTNALIFEEGMSYSASGDSGSEEMGYKKLVYRIEQIYNADGEYGDDIFADTTERTVTVLAFSEGADIDDPTQVSPKTAVITGIDNTAPIVRWSVSPEVLTYEDVLSDDGQIYKELVKHTTPGNVTFTITAQDKDSGIEKIRAF